MICSVEKTYNFMGMTVKKGFNIMSIIDIEQKHWGSFNIHLRGNHPVHIHVAFREQFELDITIEETGKTNSIETTRERTIEEIDYIITKAFGENPMHDLIAHMIDELILQEDLRKESWRRDG